MSDDPYPDASEIQWTAPARPTPRVVPDGRVFLTSTDLALADAVAEILDLQSQLESAVLLTTQYREMLSLVLTRLHALNEEVADGE